MHFVTGTLIEVLEQDGRRIGRLDVGGAIVRVELELVPDVSPGDALLAHAGVAIAKVDEPRRAAGPDEGGAAG